jgi:hypothetical protein
MRLPIPLPRQPSRHRNREFASSIGQNDITQLANHDRLGATDLRNQSRSARLIHVRYAGDLGWRQFAQRAEESIVSCAHGKLADIRLQHLSIGRARHPDRDALTAR